MCIRDRRSAGGFEENVQVLNKDFSALNTEDFAYVEYIVLDPSCSGSGKNVYQQFSYHFFIIVSHAGFILGMVQRDGNLVASKERLEKLSALQNRLLQHAMTFPNVKKIAYSTCSTSEVENENVSRKMYLSLHKKYKIERNIR